MTTPRASSPTSAMPTSAAWWTSREEEGGQARLSVSDKIDRMVTNRILALPIFAW